MNKPEIINYKGKSIYYMDFSGLRNTEDITSVLSLCKEYIHSQREKSLLILTNIEGMHFNNEVKTLFSEFVSGNKPYVKASAVYGISGLQRIVYNGVMRLTGRDIRSFDTLSLGKEWLISFELSEVVS